MENILKINFEYACLLVKHVKMFMMLVNDFHKGDI